MVCMGLLMILAGFWSLLLRRGDRLHTTPLFLKFMLCMGPSGLIALLAGWVTTEMGRQPWVVYGLMRTKDAVSPLTVGEMSISLVLFVLVYFVLFGTGITYMLKLVHKGPQPHEAAPSAEGDAGLSKTPARPMSAADDH